MKWSTDECKRGDVIRAKQGAIYHFGIYVTDEEVIQFGKAPVLRQADERDKDMEVIATDISDFACGKPVERCKFTFKDKFKKFPPDKVVSNARARLGEKGYNFLHNNCEHFAYQCATGIKYSSQEEAIKNKWAYRPVLDVYFSRIPDGVNVESVYPNERNAEIESCTNERVKAEKYWSWKTLLFALENSLGKDVLTLSFKKSSKGKWTADGVYFSLSHSGGAVAVAVSNSPVGIDIECKKDFADKYAKGKGITHLAERIVTKSETAPSDVDELLSLWTKKESIFKYVGKGYFKPSKTETGKYPLYSVDTGAYVCSICANNADKTNFYKFDGEKAVITKGETGI